MPPRLARQMGSEYRCYLSVLTGFSSHTSGGPGGRESLPQFTGRVKHILKSLAIMAQKDALARLYKTKGETQQKNRSFRTVGKLRFSVIG